MVVCGGFGLNILSDMNYKQGEPETRAKGTDTRMTTDERCNDSLNPSGCEGTVHANHGWFVALFNIHTN